MVNVSPAANIIGCLKVRVMSLPLRDTEALLCDDWTVDAVFLRPNLNDNVVSDNLQ